MAEAKTATDVLMDAMDEFGKSEGVTAIVIFTNAANEMVVMSNASRSQAIGMCEYGKQCVLRKIFEGRS